MISIVFNQNCDQKALGARLISYCLAAHLTKNWVHVALGSQVLVNGLHTMAMEEQPSG